VTEYLLVAVLVLLAVATVLLLILVLRRTADPSAALTALSREQADATRELDHSLSEQIGLRAREQRDELAVSISRFSNNFLQQMANIANVQNNQIDSFALQLQKLAQANELRLGEIRLTLEQKLRELSQDNAQKLEQMRATVDEKLHATLEQRLGASFKMVSDRLEQVHRGLGEMQVLASDVGDLKRVLTNVKTRGTWGEVQLGALLEQILIPEQYGVNIETVAGSGERVEFAIRLPGHQLDQPVWLPVDAKFPREDYERLLLAHDKADPLAAEAALKALSLRIREEGKSIRNKYVSPPGTTDFAIMFLPTEGLYAEVARRPGLLDDLQREFRIVVAGPTTLSAILSSLQMGFRTLQVEKRSSEVWQLLGAVKTEFGKFGDMLAKTRKQLETVTNTISDAESKTRTIERRLRKVESLPESSTASLLEEEPDRDPTG
jgi:DNA recombination protein RmuC